jgi:hypothetical protein
VSTLESRLRDAYRAAADTIDPATIPGLPPSAEPHAARSRRVRLSRHLAPLAAAAAVIIVAILAALPVGVRPWHHAPTVPRHHARVVKPRPTPAASLPPFIVVDLGSSLKVFSTRTGIGVATLAAPAGQQFEDVASGGAARTFLAATGLSGSACHAFFYRFELSATGQPSRLTFLRSVPGSLPTAVAAIPGGDSYAYSTVHCGTAPPNGAIGISGPTGNRMWSYDEADDYAFSLAATADGRTLAFSVPSMSGDALLSTSSRAPTVSGASQVVQSVPVSGTLAISPDGQTLYACASDGATATLAAYSTVTGRQIRVLHQWPQPPRGHQWLQAAGFNCQVSTDPTGHFLLAAVTSDIDQPSKPATLIGFDLRSGASLTLRVHPALLFRGTQLAW